MCLVSTNYVIWQLCHIAIHGDVPSIFVVFGALFAGILKMGR